jgi:hypothetical protein
LRLIGYWTTGPSSDLPDPTDFVDPSWSEEERHMVRLYLASGTIARTFMGLSPCRICGKHNGSLEYTDGTYLWPEGLAHYVDEHQVRLPDQLVRHAVERLVSLESAQIDHGWWRSAMRPPS